MTDIYPHLARPQQVADDQNSGKRAGDVTGGIAAAFEIISIGPPSSTTGKMIAGTSWLRSWWRALIAALRAAN
jgi:hypothetical protein